MLRTAAGMFLSAQQTEVFANAALRVLRASPTNHNGSQENNGGRSENT